MAELAGVLADVRGFSPEKVRQIKNAAVLHDVGKRAVSDSILGKPGKLTESEFAAVKNHTIWGAEMLSPMDGEFSEMAKMVCRNHHEWHNGKGYWGIYAGDLPEYVSIISICDVLTALLFQRAYKPAWSVREAVEYIKNQSGTQFSPELTEIFVSMIYNDSRVRNIFQEGGLIL
jgi:putative two-component system response regulator